MSNINLCFFSFPPTWQENHTEHGLSNIFGFNMYESIQSSLCDIEYVLFFILVKSKY